MNLEEQILNAFTRARYAAWANDDEHCRELLDEVLLGLHKLSGQKSSGLFELIRRASKQLTERLDRAGEDQERQRKYALSEKQLIKANHLRAVIHRTSDFEFEVKAYLEDLSWEEDLYTRAKSIASELQRVAPHDVNFLDQVNLLDERESPTRPGEDSKSLKRPTPSWRIVENNIVCKVLIGPFGLIKMKGTWIGAQPPTDIDDLRTMFERVLDQLDPDVEVQAPFAPVEGKP